MFIVLESQTHTEGTVGTLVSSFEDRNEAENAYHTILASAAISELPKHCAFMLTDDGYTIKSEMYTHEEKEEE